MVSLGFLLQELVRAIWRASISDALCCRGSLRISVAPEVIARTNSALTLAASSIMFVMRIVLFTRAGWFFSRPVNFPVVRFLLL